MNHNCEYVLRRGARKGTPCRRVALWSLSTGEHFCKNHIFVAKIERAQASKEESKDD